MSTKIFLRARPLAPENIYARHPLDILPTEDDEVDPIERLRRIQRLEKAVEALASVEESSDPIPVVKRQLYFVNCTADHSYFRRTSGEVAMEELARDADRLHQMSLDSGEDRSVPPPGLVCSALLGRIDPLL